MLTQYYFSFFISDRHLAEKTHPRAALWAPHIVNVQLPMFVDFHFQTLFEGFNWRHRMTHSTLLLLLGLFYVTELCQTVAERHESRCLRCLENGPETFYKCLSECLGNSKIWPYVCCSECDKQEKSSRALCKTECNSECEGGRECQLAALGAYDISCHYECLTLKNSIKNYQPYDVPQLFAKKKIQWDDIDGECAEACASFGRKLCGGTQRGIFQHGWCLDTPHECNTDAPTGETCRDSVRRICNMGFDLPQKYLWVESLS